MNAAGAGKLTRKVFNLRAAFAFQPAMTDTTAHTRFI
jgi:hypothetical protein